MRACVCEQGLSLPIVRGGGHRGGGFRPLGQKKELRFLFSFLADLALAP